MSKGESDFLNTLPIRVTFLARKLDNVAGGLERILIDLMNELSLRGHRVTLMTWDNQRARPHYRIAPEIYWLKLDQGQPDVPATLLVRFRRLSIFRHFVKTFRPGVIVGFQSGPSLFARIATLGIGIKVIASERVSPDMWKYTRKSFSHRITDIYLLFLADRITVQFPEYGRHYPIFMQQKIVCIPNPVHRSVTNYNKVLSNSGTILYVARFCFQKNHDLLIQAFYDLARDFPNWRLVLAGQGESLNAIKERVASMGLSERVQFCGAVRDVERLYCDADIFAFPSLFEGFPNALAEALAFGLPCVGLRSTLGVSHLIVDGVNGFLVDPDKESFAEGVKTLIRSSRLRSAFGNQASKIIDRYPPELSYRLWESLLREVST